MKITLLLYRSNTTRAEALKKIYCRVGAFSVLLWGGAVVVAGTKASRHGFFCSNTAYE